MELIYRLIGDVQIISLVGSLSGADITAIRQKVLERIQDYSPYVIIDLHSLHFVDARGLSLLISALKVAQQREGDVLLLNPTPEVRALIELTRLQHTFSIYADEEAALAYYTQTLYQAT